MNVCFSLFVGLLLNFIFVNESHAAFVQYRDEYGKIHYVNPDYAKVPDRYLGQVQDQLKAIEEKKAAEKANTSAAKPAKGAKKPPAQIQTSQPLTGENRLTRLTKALATLESHGALPPSVNIHSGIVSYTDKSGQKIFVTPENSSTVPPEYLPQIDEQILNLEKLAREATQQKPFISGAPVEVYTQADCKNCALLQTLLQANKIKYINYDVVTSPQGSEFYKKTGAIELPTTRIGSKIIHGVDIQGIRNALNQPVTN